MIKDHWFRAETRDDPCRFPNCSAPAEWHVEVCGEWMGPQHLFRPSWPLWPFWTLPWWPCRRCGKAWSHSTHLGSNKNRQLRGRPSWWRRLE